jgi:riboflavin synthase
MFTGIVQCIGIISLAEPLDLTESGGNGHSLTISNAADVLSGVAIGDSISVNGVCLTVTEFTKDSFKVNVAPETLRLTNIGILKKGSNVNLEKALSVNGSFGGSFVQVFPFHPFLS